VEVEPGFEAFARLHDAGQPASLSATLVADLETPVAAFLKLRAAKRGPAFLLESVEGGAVRGRYSMIGLEPDLVWRCEDGRAAIDRRAEGRFVPDRRAPLDSLRALIAESAMPLDARLPPMAAGLFGYLGYDMVRSMERLGHPNPDALNLPDAVLVRPTVMVVFDAVRDEIVLVSPVRPRPGVSARAAYETGLAQLESVMWALERPLPLDARADPRSLPRPEPVSNTAPEAFRAMVARAKEYILAGDVFQVVLSQRFEAPFPLPPVRALPRAPPGQPGAVPLLSRLRGLPDRVLVARDPGPGPGRRRDRPPDRGHAAPRRNAGRGPRARRGPPRRPEGAGRAPDAARPRPQRRGARGEPRQRPRDRLVLPGALQPGPAHRL
jgi:anthranilate synthase component 1